MSAADELYQDLILHHGRTPRNFGELAHPHKSAVGHNPLCGDKLRLMLQVEDGKVSDVRFTGEGCAISTAATSVMTDAVKGRTPEEARAMLAAFHALVTGSDPPEGAPDLGKLKAFEGVQRFPIRVKCAMLPWRTLEAALADEDEAVATE